MRVISIGDLVTDFYYKDGKVVGVNGGMSSHNIIANIAKLGLKTAAYGSCGDDASGLVAINSLTDIGVNTDHIKIKKNIHTRAFHVSYQEIDGKLEFTSKKRCPFCNTKRWYEMSEIDVDDILNQITQDDIFSLFEVLTDSKNQSYFKSQNVIRYTYGFGKRGYGKIYK